MSAIGDLFPEDYNNSEDFIASLHLLITALVQALGGCIVLDENDLRSARKEQRNLNLYVSDDSIQTTLKIEETDDESSF